MNIVLLVLILIPLLYECAQMYMAGPVDYITDMGNIIDLSYITCAIAMGIFHATQTPYTFLSKLLMWLVGFFCVRRTFFFFKIFASLSPVISMLSNVIWKLRIFLAFYFILCLKFGLLLGVFGW